MNRSIVRAMIAIGTILRVRVDYKTNKLIDLYLNEKTISVIYFCCGDILSRIDVKDEDYSLVASYYN